MEDYTWAEEVSILNPMNNTWHVADPGVPMAKDNELERLGVESLKNPELGE